ncbi:MAG: energy transducer TonB [Candidatus Solibacter sp.]
MRTLIFFLASLLPAAEVTGKWNGAMTAEGISIPIFLTMQRLAPELSGTIAFTSAATPVPLEKLSLQGDQLKFQAVDSANHVFAFQLTVSGRDMEGEAISEGKHLSVYLAPLRGTNGFDRWPPNSTFAPKLIHKVDPEYTEEARRAHYQGTVLVYAKVAPDGRPTDLRVLRSLGMGLDEKALECVAKWRFEPGTKDGHAVTVEVQIEVNFRL